MEIKDIVINNLVNLRKQHNYTQIELAKKVNFSDKAISRWENGEVMPDIETLNTLAGVYNISITYFFETHEENVIINEDKSQIRKKLCLAIISILAVWTISSILFVYLNLLNNYVFWQVFVWAIAASCLVALYFNKKWLKNPVLSLVLQSMFIWSLITSFYLQFLNYNLWLVYIIGIPIQAIIIVKYYLK